MNKLIPGGLYGLKNQNGIRFERLVNYVMPQKLPSIDNNLWETFYYRSHDESEKINRIIIPDRGIIDLKKGTILCYNYFPSGSFFPEQEENTQDVREWLIMIKRIEEAYSSKSMCAFAHPLRKFIFLN